jgi:hypothetical protein
MLQIQMKQMQSDNPYVDDFYFNTYQREHRRFITPRPVFVEKISPFPRFICN